MKKICIYVPRIPCDTSHLMVFHWNKCFFFFSYQLCTLGFYVSYYVVYLKCIALYWCCVLPWCCLYLCMTLHLLYISIACGKCIHSCVIMVVVSICKMIKIEFNSKVLMIMQKHTAWPVKSNSWKKKSQLVQSSELKTHKRLTLMRQVL